jgi:hypothetical protein
LYPLAVATALSGAACGGNDGSDDDGGGGSGGGGAPLEIIGSYVDDFGGSHVITAETWTAVTLIFHVDSYDNASDFLIAQNDAENEFNPDLYSRFDWHDEAGQLHYCQSVFDAASAEAAAMAMSDRTDLATGCGGFPWSKLMAQ